MVSVLIIFLVAAQLISFYLIVLLNTKIAKFKDLEVRQDKLIREMDDAISVYLMEMREENDRLIQELSGLKKSDLNYSVKNNGNLDNINNEERETKEPPEIVIHRKNVIPKNVVKKAYQQQKVENPPVFSDILHQTEELTFEQKVIQLHQQGKSTEEIAKVTQKGKTEIELVLKFNI